MDERRNNTRLSIKLEVELYADDQECSLQTRDLSNNGVYLEKGETNLPAEGSIVHLRVKQPMSEGEEPPLVKARIIRIDADGIALQFITE